MISDPQFQRRLTAALGFCELGLFQEAVEELESLPTELRETRFALVVWLELYQGWQKWGEAASVAMRLAENEPDDSNWQVVLAYATRRSRGLASARDILIDACQRFPDCALIQFNLACYEAQMGFISDAKKRLQRAINIDQRFAELARTDPDLEPVRSAST